MGQGGVDSEAMRFVGQEYQRADAFLLGGGGRVTN
jgi:hypothetical protein